LANWPILLLKRLTNVAVKRILLLLVVVEPREGALPSKNYYFVFTLSGHDVTGQPIRDISIHRQIFSAKTQEQAERQLRDQYFKRVVVNIKSVTCQ
jgi:hypothetical protein